MNKLTLLLLCLGAVSAHPFGIDASNKQASKKDPECANGAVFWCQNIINAKKCNAVDFCIKSVWETHLPKVDTDIICDDCKEWVGKARDMIVQEDKSGDIERSLKWTCDLIPMASLKTSCEQVVDQYIPEILKMLESKMDPVTVCSQLFFCNNAKYDKVLTPANEKLLPFTCSQCNHIGSVIESKFKQLEQEGVLEKVLGMCGELSSYSDSCSSLVIMHIDDIFSSMTKMIDRDNICSTTKACANHQYRKEGIIDIVPAIDDQSNPNIACQLCQQLVLHLRELLITNTTEIEFRNIMVGFCGQMGSFSNECLEITYQYYDVIYKFLVDKLNASQACVLIDICLPQANDRQFVMPPMPLVSAELHPLPEQPKRSKVIEFVMDESSLVLYKNGSLCTTCEYFIHFLQDALRKQSTEDDIVNLMKKTCKDLPQKVQGECVALVDLYGDAMWSLLDQNLDARFICPKLKLCPPNLTLELLEISAVDEKPTCPFCLLAMQEIRDIIDSNSTKQNIENVVGKLCAHLSDKLKGQCLEFVKQYSEEVVEMVLADFTPQEACTFIKLCTDNKPPGTRNLIIVEDEDFDDLEDDQDTTVSNPQCELCKEIVKVVEQRVINKKSKDEIRRELEKSCSRLKKFTAKCVQFVDKYSDTIVDLIEKELEPQEVCRELIFCVSFSNEETQDYDSGLEILKLAVNGVDDEIKTQPQCVLCEFIMAKLDSELNDKTTDEKIKQAVRNVCAKMPSTVAKSCKQFIDYYFDMIIVFIETMKPSEVCGEMRLCPAPNYEDVMMLQNIQSDVYECAVCKGLVDGLDSIIEDPGTDTNIENLEEKLCEKLAGNYKTKCHDLARNYGLVIINLLKNLTHSEEICYKLNLCSMNAQGVTGMAQLL